MIKYIYPLTLLIISQLVLSNEINLTERVVTVKSQELKLLDVPGSVNLISSQDISKATLKVNLSEVLDETPGVLALDRGNYAKDISLSVRGFGTRSQTAGIRGQQIFIDGIPLTLPDGQSQSQNISLGTAGRIEIIKGPLATLYGNASGGVIQIYTRVPENRILHAEQIFGSWNQYKSEYQLADNLGQASYLIDYSTYKSDGYRLNSQIMREHLNGIFTYQINDDLKLKLSANAFDEPYAYDPRTLTLADALNNSYKSTSPVIDRLRKVTQQNQFGQSLEYKLNSSSHIALSTYFGDRSVQQFSTPSTLSTAAKYIESQRDYNGINLAFNTRNQFYERPIDITLTATTSSATEQYIQGNAQNGDPIPNLVLRRDERVMSSSSFASQANFHLTDNLSLLAGLRQTNVKVNSDDKLQQISQGNISYNNLGYILGVSNLIGDKTNLYFNYGIGFETPTLTEVSYTRVGSVNQNVFNTSLKEAKNSQYELGVRSFMDKKSYIDLTGFLIKTKNEIAVDLNPNGSNISYKNIPEGTTRKGLELSYIIYPIDSIKFKMMGTLMQAEFDASYISGSAFVPAGNRVPGVPQKNFVLGAQYSNKNFIQNQYGFSQGWLVGYDLSYMGNIYTADANDLKAPSYSLHRLSLSYGWDIQGINLSFVGRLNNIFDKRYVSSIQVSNPIPFEPGAPKNWLMGLRGQVRF